MGKSKFTGHLCYLRYFCSCAHYNDVYSLMKFSTKCTQYHYAHGGGGGGGEGGGVGACYTDYGAFQDLYHILEYKNRIQYKVSFLSKYL